MPERFLTTQAEAMFVQLAPGLRAALAEIEVARFDHAAILLDGAARPVGAARTDARDDALLQDLFVLERYLGLIRSYVKLWRAIWMAEFAGSWNALQDAMDSLRLIKKFSAIEVAFFESQLLQLETGYPYHVFMSIGAIVDQFDCSICGRDIDGLDCAHRRGELYSGRLAYGIARNEMKLDHVSLVLDPDDKRCVVTLADRPAHFPILSYIRDQWLAGTLRIGHLARLEWSKRPVPNPQYGAQSSIEPCACGSGEMSKDCCLNKPFVEQDHVELVGEAREIGDAVV